MRQFIFYDGLNLGQNDVVGLELDGGIKLQCECVAEPLVFFLSVLEKDLMKLWFGLIFLSTVWMICCLRAL